jgi:hypothetical protein
MTPNPSVGCLCLLYAEAPSAFRNGVSRFQPHWWPAAETAAVCRLWVKFFRKHPGPEGIASKNDQKAVPSMYYNNTSKLALVWSPLG